MNRQLKQRKMSTYKDKVNISDNTMIGIGDSCTTPWKGNGEMRVLDFYWSNKRPIRVIRLRDSAQFHMQMSDLISYNVKE